MKKRTIRLLAFKLFLVFFPFLLIEIIGRMIPFSFMTQVTVEDDWFRYSRRLHWENRPGFEGDLAGAYRKFASDGLVAEDSAMLTVPADTHILLLGDSCTFGYGVDVADTYGKILERTLPSTRVTNLAVIGYSSYQGKRALEKAIRKYKPDIVIISFNYNDRRYVIDTRYADSSRYFLTSWLTNRVTPPLLKYSGLFRTLFYLGDRTITPKEFPEYINVNALSYRVRWKDYYLNLCDMAKISKNAEAVPVFLALGDNPRLSYHIYQGISLYKEKNYPAAIDLLSNASEKKIVWSELARKYLHESYRRIGDLNAAKEVALVHDYMLSRNGGRLLEADHVYYKFAREACNTTGMLYVDATEILHNNPEVFIDMVHFDSRGHQLIADLLIQHLLPLQLGLLQENAQIPQGISDELLLINSSPN